MTMASDPLLVASGLRRSYRSRGRRRGGGTAGIADVRLAVGCGEVVGVLGVSGAGKTTLARILAGLDVPDAGTIALHGRTLDLRRRDDLAALRRSVQLVFQDPFVSLDPRQTVGGAVAEPLVVRRVGRDARRERVRALLDAVALPAEGDLERRLPRALSGGERQRVAIARALACEPEILVLDEPVSALDVPVRRQIIDVLLELRSERNLALVVITHEPRLAARICDRVIVLASGSVVDETSGARLLTCAGHPATRELVEAAGVASAPDGET